MRFDNPQTMTEPQEPYVFTEHENVARYDWRLRAVTTLTEPVVSQSGIVRHPIGAPVVAVCPVQKDRRTVLTFNFPNVTALLLDYSHKLYGESANLEALLSEPKGTVEWSQGVPNDEPFLDLLELRIASAVFAFTGIEAFANEALAHAYTHQGWVYSIPDPRNDSPYTLETIERFMPLEEKLCGALPEFFKVNSLKQVNPLWQSFCQLRRIRHLAVHPKLEVQKNPKERTLWKLLTDDEYCDFALVAKAIMMHYAADGSYTARWLHRCPF